MPIQVTCPHCERSLWVGTGVVGDTIACPGCQHQLPNPATPDPLVACTEFERLVMLAEEERVTLPAPVRSAGQASYYLFGTLGCLVFALLMGIGVLPCLFLLFWMLVK